VPAAGQGHHFHDPEDFSIAPLENPSGSWTARLGGGGHTLVAEAIASMTGYQVVPIGQVESPLTDRAQAPRQGDEGAPSAWLVFAPEVADAVRDLAPGTEVIVLTWLDRADRDVLVTRPRDDSARPLTGVVSTRSPDRPNPIGLHRVQIVAVEGLRIHVQPLEALDKTPVIDIKPVLDQTTE
jgi:tRNA-Thr(GGU) m(6)t(6)A37 methyltransferase TsaA